jgi:hypothetical protein
MPPFILRQSLGTGIGESKDHENDEIYDLNGVQATANNALTTC